VPEPPTFSEPIEDVRGRISKEMGRVAAPRDLSNPHPAMVRALAEEEERRAAARREPLWAWRHEL
jgi:hypothetical protein